MSTIINQEVSYYMSPERVSNVIKSVINPSSVIEENVVVLNPVGSKRPIGNIYIIKLNLQLINLIMTFR